MRPLISVIIPIYQVEKYIKNMISSVCEQSFKNFEVILVDDGTRDQSVIIAEEVLKSYKFYNYKLIRQKNSGVSVARNNGILSASGEWIICIDSDDYLLKDFLKSLLNTAKKFKEKSPQIVIGNFQLKNSLNYVKNNEEQKSKIQYIEKTLIIEKYLKREIKIISPAMLIKKDFLISNNILYNPNVIFSEDTLFIWSCILQVKGILYNSEVNYIYLLHENSTMSSSSKNKILNGFENYKLFTESLSDKKLGSMIMARWVIATLHSSAKMLKYRTYKELAYNMNYLHYIEMLKEFPELITRIIGRLAKVSLPAMYLLCRIK